MIKGIKESLIPFDLAIGLRASLVFDKLSKIYSSQYPKCGIVSDAFIEVTIRRVIPRTGITVSLTVEVEEEGKTRGVLVESLILLSSSTFLLSLYDKEVNTEKSQMIRCETISELQRNPKKK